MRESELAACLTASVGGKWQLRALGASSFCDTWQAKGDELLFVKSASGDHAAMLDAESDGLRALAAVRAIRVPRVVADGPGWLAMEWLDLQAPDAGFGARLAAALAALHREPCPLDPPRFGWRRGNFIGSTPQRNDFHSEWSEFFRTQRLRPMRDRLAERRAAQELLQAVDTLIERVPSLSDDGHVPRPSLVHGDLWQGNWGMLADGTPVIFDPAVSYSDAEAELAMMELFGSAPAGFWPAYRQAASLAEGYALRRPLYQLYHLLNHAVLFDGGYAQQALDWARGLVPAR